MAVKNAMFIFEVVVADVTSFVESRHLVIRSEFSDIFSLELRDPKTMHIVIPEAPPPPPEPPGKKGKKAKKPPKPKKGKKGKNVEQELPPPKPDIQSGQSVLFTSNAEFLLENMLKYPMNLSLWSKEKQFSNIASTVVPWDPAFINFLKLIVNCQEPPPVVVRDDYNIFEEGTAKIIAKIGMKITLRYLTDRVTSSFRSLSEDPSIRKFLYTGMNAKTTSFICNMNTKEEHFQKNCNKIRNSYIKDRPQEPLPIAYADYKNAPAVNMLNSEIMECCQNQADKIPDSKYKSPVCPDIDFICDYVRKLIVSCNDAMRHLTPRPTIRPRVRATDIDRLCYCRETSWPQSKLADRFRREVQGPPCPICSNKGKPQGGSYADTFDLACIRGPCGSADCKVARELREYILKQVAEDNEVFNLNSLIGPCGSRTCTIAEQISDFLQHRGAFEHDLHTKEGLSTQCDCHQQMQNAIMRRNSCADVCSKKCEDADSSDSSNVCDGAGCPYKKNTVYQVYYFTVEYDKTPTNTSATSLKSASSQKSTSSKKSTGGSSKVSGKTSESNELNYCSKDCPTVEEKTSVCSKSVCFPQHVGQKEIKQAASDKCMSPVCPTKQNSPPDSHIVIPFSSIRNPCCVKDCKVEQDVKEFILRGLEKSSVKASDNEDPCYCDCICDMKFSKRTTYCAVCGGYECLGDDARALPEYQKPHPCPVYNKLYNRRYIKTTSPWPDTDSPAQKGDTQSNKSAKTVASSKGAASAKRFVTANDTNEKDKKKKTQPTKEKENDKDKKKSQNKKVSKFTANTSTAEQNVHHHVVCHTTIIPVPKNMGWNWKADDIPGLKYRPDWKPGCALKRLVNRYRAIREPLESVLAKKKLKAMMLSRKKRTKVVPTVSVIKKNGEYTVKMEVLKKYSKERLLNQCPFDDTKEPLVYTIGKTEEEKAKIQKHHDRRERRKTRRHSRMLQSAFRDKCQEICVKAYNQAIGLLPLPDPNNPSCPCDLETVIPSSTPADSCSCSESGSISTSETDGDEWTVEFYPPSARWEPQLKPLPRGCDNSTQYTYLDYRVKLLDKQGNQIPRFFKGPDGKEVCSDLGGFWSPDHTWLEINRDGHIGPDNRWVPINFIGPDGLGYSSEDGNFKDNKGKCYKIGVDGYIDVNGKWAWYPRSQPRASKTKTTATATTMDSKKAQMLESRKSAANVRTKEMVPGKKVVMAADAAIAPSGHGAKVAKGKPRPVVSPPVRGPMKPISLPFGARANKHRCQLYMAKDQFNQDNNLHGEPNMITPSPKYIEMEKMNKYNEIMQDLNMYEDFVEFKSPQTINRACMTSTGPHQTEMEPNQCSYYSRNVRPTASSAFRTRPRLRPIDSMKIYGLESLKPHTLKSFNSMSGVHTSTATYN